MKGCSCIATVNFLRKSDNSLFYLMNREKFLRNKRLQNMHLLKNAHPLIIIPLIREQPFATLFYTWIKKYNSSIIELSKYMGYLSQRTGPKLVFTGQCRLSIIHVFSWGEC